MGAKMVMACYKAKPGKADDLLDVLRSHVPSLRQMGLVTDHPCTLLQADDNSFVEIFEWVSEDASKKAHDIPRIQKIWSSLESLSDFAPLNQLPQSSQPFAEFTKVAPKRMNRVSHFEIHADDAERCAKFYERLFGWEVYQWANEPYFLVNTGDDGVNGINGGILKRDSTASNGSVQNTVSVQNIEETLKEVLQFGGKVMVPKTPIEGVGWLAYAQDTEGNVFGVMQNQLT